MSARSIFLIPFMFRDLQLFPVLAALNKAVYKKSDNKALFVEISL